LILAANAETDLSGLAAIDAYAAGDLDGDGRNDLFDFVLFKQAYVALNGSASFSQLIAGVPEPVAVAHAVAAMITLGAARPRRLARTV
jgi:hypothetical protein